MVAKLPLQIGHARQCPTPCLSVCSGMHPKINLVDGEFHSEVEPTAVVEEEPCGKKFSCTICALTQLLTTCSYYFRDLFQLAMHSRLSPFRDRLLSYYFRDLFRPLRRASLGSEGRVVRKYRWDRKSIRGVNGGSGDRGGAQEWRRLDAGMPSI